MISSIPIDTDNRRGLQPARVRTAFDLAAGHYDQFAVLQRTVADRAMESFEYLRVRPKQILDMGSGTGYGARQLNRCFKGARICQLDISTAMLNGAREKMVSPFSPDDFLCADASQLPLAADCCDLVFSNLMLQWCEDLDRVFAEVQRVLRQGGLFLFTVFGPDSLKELRESWRRVDEGVHVNTFVDMHDIGDGLVRQGLNSPVLHVEHLVLDYAECKHLMRELKQLGAGNINQERRKTLTGKSRMQAMIRQYETYRVKGRLPATYEVIYGHAWCSQAGSFTAESGDTQSVFLQDLKQELFRRR